MSSIAALILAFIILIADMFVNATGGVHGALAFAGAGLLVYALIGLIIAGKDVEWIAAIPDKPTASEQDASHVLRLLPLCPPLVVFWLLYSQMMTNFQMQGRQMNLYTMGTRLSPATVAAFDAIGILILTPVVNLLLYPMLAKCGIKLGIFSRVLIGFVFTALAMVSSALVEIYRKESGIRDASGTLPMSNMSVWWQAPQYMLVALGEIFTAITAIELFYLALPPHLRSIGQGMNFFCHAVGSLATAAVAAACVKWTPTNLDDGKLENEYFLLAALMVAVMPLWWFVMRKFKMPTFD